MKNTKQLGEEKIPKLLMRLSIPAIVGMLVNGIYNIVDRIFIGNGVNSLGLAGATIGFPIMIVMMGLGMLIAMGATPLISLKLGEGKKDEAELILGNGFCLVIAISLIASLTALAFLEPLLRLLGSSDAVLPYAMDYLGIILWGNVFQAIAMGMNGFIRAEGNGKIAMYTMLIGAVMNIILDPLFIFVFKWGMKGAALATITSQAVSAGWVLFYYLTKRSSLRLHIHNLRLKLSIVGRIIAIGFAPFVLQIASSILALIMNKSLVHYGGDIAISGMGVVNSILLFIQMPIYGINQGSQPIIGYNYGAKRYDRVKETLKLAIISATVLVCIDFAVVQLAAYQLVSLFSKNDIELIEYSAYALRICTMLLPVVGFQIVGANYFQAIGKPKYAAFLSLSRQVFILIPAILILSKYYQLKGILIAAPISDFLSFIITGIFVFREIKKLNNNHEQIQNLAV